MSAPLPRSYLFVPGHRPDRFAKAAASGAHRIILDLEDAVGPADKAAARQHVAAWFAGGGTGLVRINGMDTPWCEADLAMLHAAPNAEVMVPKADEASVSRIAAQLPGRSLVGLVETVAGLLDLARLARIGGLSRLAFGNLDFGADARIPGTGSVLDPARFQLVLHSRAADLPPPIDGVSVEIGDVARLGADVAEARALGLTAKLCIHPSQVDPVNRGFAPSASEIDWARRIIEALAGSAGAAVQVEGKMVDRPLAERARSILAEAGGPLPDHTT